MTADPASMWEICASCSAPLAGDQRYCLACGERRAGARLPFLDVLRADAAGGGSDRVPPASRAAHGVDAVNERLRRNAPLLGLLGVLAVMMLIGVLVGHWAGGDPKLASAPATRVITVGGGAAPPSSAPATAAAPTPSKKSARKSAKKGSGGAKRGAPTNATNTNLKNLQNLSGREYQKQVDKLGKTIGTGGKPPPKDKKPPAGGGSFEEIG